MNARARKIPQHIYLYYSLYADMGRVRDDGRKE